jgi:hypothetical protein
MTSAFHEERIALLLRLLRPAPRGWVQAAQELPAARRTMDDIVARAEQDAEFQAALVADLEAALAAEGYEPSRPLLDELRKRYPAA